MSALRNKSLDLFCFEAFIAVEGQENISAAARELGVSQSTVSRAIQGLEKWLGMKLIEPGKVEDPDDPRVSIGITSEGREIRDLASSFLEKLNSHRTEQAIRESALDAIDAIICTMEKDLYEKRNNKTVLLIKNNIKSFREHWNGMKKDTPSDMLLKYQSAIREFFLEYEIKRADELGSNRRRTKGSLRKLAK